MKRIFLDTNVLLDLIDADRPAHSTALEIEHLMEQSNLQGLLAWHSLSIIEYVGGKKFGVPHIHRLLNALLEVFSIPATSTADAKKAFQYLSSDLEDALQISCALAGNADVIVSNDKNGFEQSPIPVMTPEELIARPRTIPRSPDAPGSP